MASVPVDAILMGVTTIRSERRWRAGVAHEGAARMGQALVLAVLMAVSWPQVSWSQKGPGSACYRVEGERVTYHRESFVVLNRSYAKDSRCAYFQGQPIADVDLATFEANGPHQAQDQNRSYDARGRSRAVDGPTRSSR